MRTDKTVIFVHIPKTAGTTLHRIIWRFYRHEEVYAIDGKAGAVEEFKQLSPERREQIRLLTGHMDFGLHRWIPRPYLYITLLREPIDCVISHYHYACREPKHPNYAAIHDQNMSLSDYVQSGLEIMTSNSQTRMVSGRWTELDRADCPPEALVEAKRNLREHFSVVGLTERFDETLFLLKAVAGWDQLFYVRQNETPNRPKVKDLSLDTLTSIRKANALDLELYQYATQLFREQIRKQGLLFAYQVAIFKLKNHLISAEVRKEWGLAPAK